MQDPKTKKTDDFDFESIAKPVDESFDFESIAEPINYKEKKNSAQDLRPPLQQPIAPSATPTTGNKEFAPVSATPTPQGYELKPIEVVAEKPNEYEKMRGAYLYGLKNYTENDEDYDILRSNVSPQRKIELLEKRRSEQLPIENQDFLQEAAGAIGGTIKGMGKTMLAGFAASPLSPISSVIASTGVAMGDGFRQGFASAYKEAYNDAIQQGMTPEQAIEKAENVAQIGGYGGVAEGFVGALPLTKQLTKLAKPASKLFQKGLEIAVDASVDASVAAGAQLGTNIAAQKEGLKRELTSGVKEAAIGEFAFGAGMNLSMPAFKYISKMTISSLATDRVAAKDRKEAITIAATQPIEVTNKALEESVKQGEITEQRANEIAEEVVSRQKALNAMPADMDLDEKNELADKVQERQRLEKEKETANEMVKPFIELKINELDKSVAIPLPPKYIDTAGQNTSELKDGQLYITRKGDVRMWDANLKQFLEPRSSFEVKAGTEVELEPTVTEIKEKEPKKTAATETGTKVVDDKIVEVEEGSNTLSEAEQTPKELSSVEETAKALEGKKASLDEKAKKLGYIGIKQFNAQNQLREDLNAEEKELLKEYSDFQQEVKNLKDESVISKLNDDEFSAWSKANDITRDDLGKVVKDEELELAAKRIRILNARGDAKKAESELKKLRESKKKDNWTVESWKERFDEDVSQSEIDEINESNKAFNEELDKQLVKAVESLIGKPTTPKELSSVEETAKALEGVDESKLPEIIDEESYLAKNGAPFMGGAEPALHKNIQEGRAKQQMIKRVSDEMNRNNQKREELRKEYAQKIKEGKILSPSRNDKLIATANSNPDLESTQAARRLLEKKGIDWGIGKSKLQSISEAYHKAKADGSNPELVKAVEGLLGKQKESSPTPQTGKGEREVKQQIETFGVPKQDVEPVHNVITQVFDGLKKAGLTAAKTVGEWVGIGKGEAKPYTLKINGEEKTVKPVNSEVVNGFYSPLEKTINETKFDKLPAKQWIEKFARGEEAKWTGLNEWLSQQQGSVSKADIQKFLKENRIEVVEVVKNSENIGAIWNDKYEAWETTVDGKPIGDFADTKDEAIRYGKANFGDATKFGNYQLAGEKENYKEVLVTMPKKYSEKERSDAEDRGIMLPANNEKNVFSSSHFDEPNILVHLRMNTRTDSEGNKVLFIEEVQSDWGQKGKKEGFLLTEKEAGKAWEEADKKYADFMNRMEKKYGSEWESELTKDEVNEEGKLLDARENTKGGNVPQSPFVTDTNAWTKLGLKTALKEAVAQGADKIAWTTGEQQNDRYDLSNSVDDIYTSKYGEEWVDSKYEKRKEVEITLKGGEVKKLVVDENGKVVRGDFAGERLDNIVGKDISEKLLSINEDTNLSGDGLKIGGKGMKGFYGEPSEGKEGIVGGVAKALVKELTGKPAEIVETKIKLGDKLASGYDVTIKDENGRVTTHNFDTKSQGLAWLSKQKNIEVISEKAEGIETSTQHSIEITPELRAAVEKGQPLFKEAEAQYRIESGKNIIEAIKDFDGSPRATVALTHEIMHPTVVSIIDGAKEGNEVGAKHTATIVNEFNKANPNSKVTIEDLIKGNDAFKDGTTSKQYRAVQEFIAKSWEQYHTEGAKGFSKSFQEVLDAISEAFRSVYKSLTGEQLTPELRKMFDDILGKEELSTNETTPTKEVSTPESKIKSWIDKWEELKKENDNEQLDLFYNKVKVALNGYAQGKGVVDEFTKLKSEIEQFAKERKAKPKEQGNKERVSSNSNEGNSALRAVESTAKALEASSLKFTDTPSLKNVEAISLEDANLSATEEANAIKTINQNNENKSWDKALRGDAKNVGNGWFKVGSTMSGESILYSPEQNKAIVIKGAKSDEIAVQDFVRNNFGNPKQTAEAYHKAKADGSNPELVKAVEGLLDKKSEPTTVQETQAEAKSEQGLGEQEIPAKEPAPVPEITEADLPKTVVREEIDATKDEELKNQLLDEEANLKAIKDRDARQQEAERSGQKPERAKPKPKVELTPLELAKQKLQQAKEKAKAVRDSKSNLSAVSDPFGDAKKQAEADREVFDAYVDLAKEYIKQGVKDIEQFAIEIGEDVTDTLRGAWDVAKGGVKKTVATKRAYEGTFRAEVRSEIEKYGLTREIESQVEAEKKARNFIDAVGENTAFEAVKNNDVVGGEAAAVLGDILRRNEAKIPLLKSEDDVKALNEFQGRVIEELGKKALEGGRFNAMLDRIYQTTDLGFNAEKRISDYVKEFGSIPKEVEQKFRDLEAQVKEVNAKLAEAERKAKEAEEKQAIDNIKESVSNEVKKSKSPAKIYGITRIAKGLDDLADALGARKSVVSNSDAKVTSALAEIGRGLIEEGIATTRNVSEKIREYLQRNFAGKINFDKYESDVLLEITGATTNDGIKIPHSMIRQFVKDGIDNIDDLTTAVHEVLVKADPNITERQVRDAITGYGKVVMPTKDEIDISIRKMKRIGRVISALEDIANKKRPLRSGKQRDLLDAEERALNKELREAMKDLPMDEDTKANQLKTRLDAAKKRLENQIEDLEREIEKGEANKRSTKPLIEDEELTLLKERRDELKKERDAIIKDEEFNEKKRLETAKKRTQQSIAELQRKLQEGDFSKKQTKPIIADDELTKLKAEKLRIKEEYDKEFYKAQLNNRSKFEKLKDRLWEVWNIPRVLMATGEWSFVGIQGLKQSIAHPTYAVKAFKNALSVMKSDESAEKFIREIKSQEWHPIMKESKLALTEPNAELTAREELFYSGWTNAIWNLAGSVILQPAKFKSIESYKNALAAWDNINPIKATERAAVGYLDTLRVLRFLDGMKMLEMQGKDFQNNKQDYKDVADAINTMTGRASLGKAEMLAPQLSKVFFSPRNWASGIKTATPYALYYFGKMTPTARKMALSDLSKMVGLTTAMVGMAAAYLNNDDDDETSVELDPRSTDFMKIKLGDTRIDPWGGMQQQIVLSARIMADAIMKGFALAGEKPPIEGAIKKDKKILPLGVTYKTKSATDLIIQQAANKLNPAATLVYNFLQSQTDKQGKIKNKYGQDYTLNKEFSDKFYPIFWGTAYELLKEDPSALNGLLTFYAFFGGGVMVYEEKQKNKK